MSEKKFYVALFIILTTPFQLKYDVILMTNQRLFRRMNTRWQLNAKKEVHRTGTSRRRLPLSEHSNKKTYVEGTYKVQL